MPVNLEAYRAAIGFFNCLNIVISVFRSVMNRCVFIVGFLLITLFIVYILTILANDIELEPGPFTMLKFGHLNVRSLNNEDKFDELSILVKENNFHIFALTETWLYNSVNSDSLHIRLLVIIPLFD